MLEYIVCKRLESLCASYRRTGGALRLVWAVYILNFNEGFRIVKSKGYLGGELALLVYKVLYRNASFLKIAQVLKSVVKVTKGRVVKSARHFLTVSRNKGNGIALVDKVDGAFYLFFFDAELLGECL